MLNRKKNEKLDELITKVDKLANTVDTLNAYIKKEIEPPIKENSILLSAYNTSLASIASHLDLVHMEVSELGVRSMLDTIPGVHQDVRTRRRRIAIPDRKFYYR